MLAEKEREEKIRANINLVHACAARFKGRGVDYDDLFQAGCIGLIKSVDGFDKSKGFAFSTYAVPVILGEIRSIFRSGGSVKVGRVMKEKGRLALAHRREFMDKNGKEPTISQLAEMTGMSAAETVQALGSQLPVVSLTADNDCEMDIKVPSPETEISDSLALKQCIAKLEPLERRIIYLRYFKEFTQVHTASVLGITQVQVSRKEKKALLRLRELMSG